MSVVTEARSFAQGANTSRAMTADNSFVGPAHKQTPPLRCGMTNLKV